MKNTNKNSILEKYLGRLDLPVFFATIFMVLFITIWAIVDQKNLVESLLKIQYFLTSNLAWFYVSVTSLFLIVSIYLAFGKYGKVKLGNLNDKPEFSYFSWISMLIAGGVGVGYVYWPIGESLMHFHNTPYLAQSGSEEAKTVAVSISMLHWGFHTWNLYALAGLAIAIPAFKFNKPMNISIALQGLFGDKILNSPGGRLAEFIGTFSTMAGVSTGLGLGLIVINGGFKVIWGYSLSPFLMCVILAAIIIAYMIAAMSGVGKGIRILAEVNTYAMLLLFVFIIIAGPTIYMFGGAVESIGAYINNFIYMSTFTDFTNKTDNWLGGWSVFYWLWWISWAPFCGGFFARISKGRTVREFIIGVAVVPAVTSIVWFGILGNAAQYIAEFNTVINLWDAVSKDAGEGIFIVTQALVSPAAATIINIVILVIMFIFIATVADSASFFVAMQMARGSLEPKPLIIMICGGFIGALALALLLTGGLDALKTASVIAGACFIVVLILMIISLLKTLIQHENI